MSDLHKINVFLPVSQTNSTGLGEELCSVLRRAGMEVYSAEAEIPRSNCSVHILFPQFDQSSGEQFRSSVKQLGTDPTFRIFVWLPPSTSPATSEPAQQDFINEVRNNISRNMVFSNASSPIQLADDIRSQMEIKTQEQFDLNATDIFLVSNQLDENEANEIIDMLSDIVPVERLNIIQDSDTDYSELCKQQIAKSKLAVVYFKQSADWALPFTQQVWKKIGGATSHTPILLIGDEDPDTNFGKKFSAPKVVSLIIAGELIPLEIKVQYDKVTLTPVK
jgi:hypothetical protein